MTDAFYEQWVVVAKEVRPHQTPPTKEQFEWILSILPQEDQNSILHQFDQSPA